MRRTVLLLLGGVTLPGVPAEAIAQASAPELTPFQTSRVERFLEQRIACRGCHQIGGSGGLVGPSLDGIGERAEYDYVLSAIRDPSGTIPGTSMPRQRMPEREARRLAAYLMTLPTEPIEGTPQAPSALAPADSLDGAALYGRYCVACHGASGLGDGWNTAYLPVTPTAHADPEAMAPRPDDTLYDGIAAGGYILDKSPLMPPFGELLSPAQIRALVAHIRTLCACEQPEWARGG